MNVLVIGGGGREHALIWKIQQNPEVKKTYCVPGNGGITALAECPAISSHDFRQLGQFVKEKGIDFTVVGPEQPLVQGIVDYFMSEGLPIFGPNQSAARLEGSKIFSKQLLAKYRIPTAPFATFTDPNMAFRHVEGLPEGPVVVKADGLAAGKGSIVCQNKSAARDAVSELMTRRIFKDAGTRIVIEAFMTGEEVSIFVITDGKDYITLTPAQDFKRALDGDQGKNTGGMGSYAPTPFLDSALHAQVTREILAPTLSALQSEGIDYRGVLYCGLMLTPEGPQVVEFNCRFGDPETQVVLPLLETDLLEIMQAVSTQTLGQQNVRCSSDAAVSVVLASGGYPDAYTTDKVISGLDTLDKTARVFHAGTRRKDRTLLTNGGRVLNIVGIADNLEKAAQKAYATVSQIHFEGMHYRKDIARRALQHS